MSLDQTIQTAVILHARRTEALKTFTSVKILLDEGDKVFASYEIPGRGSVRAWVPVGDPEVEEEPRTVAYLRSRIDDIDHYRNKAITTLKRIKEETKYRNEDLDPFMSLTVLLAEEVTSSLMRELRELHNG